MSWHIFNLFDVILSVWWQDNASIYIWIKHAAFQSTCVFEVSNLIKLIVETTRMLNICYINSAIIPLHGLGGERFFLM